MAKARPDTKEEALLWQQGGAFVFGVDEAGRGCLAGPVCAAVACWAPFSSAPLPPADVYDSKQMTEAEREGAFDPIRAHALAHGVGFASAGEIDRWNILRATHLAVARALELALAQLCERLPSLKPSDRHLFTFLADGNRPLVAHAAFFAGSAEYAAEFPRLRRLLSRPVKELCFVKGDGRVYSIASASVLAKVSRDRHMAELHVRHPAYEFSAHKGYGTPLHLEKLQAAGPCIEHRHTFAPVSALAGLFS